MLANVDLNPRLKICKLAIWRGVVHVYGCIWMYVDVCVLARACVDVRVFKSVQHLPGMFHTHTHTPHADEYY